MYHDSLTLQCTFISLMCLQLHTLGQLACKICEWRRLIKRLTRSHMCSQQTNQMTQTAGVGGGGWGGVLVQRSAN